MKINSLSGIELSRKNTLKDINNSYLNLAKFNKLQIEKTGKTFT